MGFMFFFVVIFSRPRQKVFRKFVIQQDCHSLTSSSSSSSRSRATRRACSFSCASQSPSFCETLGYCWTLWMVRLSRLVMRNLVPVVHIEGPSRIDYPISPHEPREPRYQHRTTMRRWPRRHPRDTGRQPPARHNPERSLYVPNSDDGCRSLRRTNAHTSPLG